MRGVQRSATFRTKGEAAAWAAQLEAEISAGAAGIVVDKSVRELIERYISDVLPSRRAERQESLRLARIADSELGYVRLPRLGPEHIAAWRDARLIQVSPASVRREWNTLSSAFRVAIDEWRWLAKHPMKSVKRPESSPSRDRRPTNDELERISVSCGYVVGSVPVTKQARVMAAALFAIETGMRQAEIAVLRREWIDRKVIHIPEGISKSGRKRDVPLSSAAREILAALPQDNPVFGMAASSIESLWRKAKRRACVEGLTFHDLKHEAATRLSKRLEPLALAKMLDHADLRMLLEVYYKQDAQADADLLG